MVRRLLAPLAVVALLGLGLSQVRRDVQPPQLYLELPERAAAGAPFRLFVSASEPATFRLRYGALELEEVAQDLTLMLPAAAGATELELVAVDAAGNEARELRTVTGVAALEPGLELPAEVAAGAAFGLRASWRPTGAAVEAVEVHVDGEPVEALPLPDGVAALALAPLGHADAVWPVRVVVRDEFGREAVAEGAVRVVADRRAVEELNLSASTLSVITPEGRAQEAAALARGYADPAPLPLWRAPWLLPVEGRNTSGYGRPRRYAPGGPVSRHGGADIGAPAGTPVLVPAAGVVKVAGDYPIKGGFVMIDHGGGVHSLYLHLSEVGVAEGQRVRRGERLGAVGSTGLSTGPHLHWEVRLGGRPTDPLAWVGRVLPGLDAGDPLAGLEPPAPAPSVGGE